VTVQLTGSSCPPSVSVYDCVLHVDVCSHSHLSHHLSEIPSSLEEILTGDSSSSLSIL
jgi:hypothetical protein